MSANSSCWSPPVMRRLIALLAGLCLASLRGAEPAPPASEFQVKAVFLFNFAQFVEWPAKAFATPTAPLVIGVLGEDPFGSYLDEVVQGERVSQRPIVVRRFSAVADISACHILFISESESGRLGEILAALKDRSILTVSDAENFSHEGGIVRFVTESGKTRMRINVEAARACGLTISSKIIRPATIVTREKG